MAMTECKECGSQVSENADNCPNCGVSNPAGSLGGWWKNQGCLAKIFIIFALLMLIGGVASVFQKDSGASSSSTAETKTYAVGDSFRLGGFSYAVHKVEETDRVGNKFMGAEASSGASLLIVWFTIRNEGKKTETVLTDDFKIKTPDGTTFRASSDANTALSTEYEDKDLLLSELQPGLEKTTATVFEVPQDVTEDTFYVSVPEKGFLSSGNVRVEVTPDEIQ